MNTDQVENLLLNVVNHLSREHYVKYGRFQEDEKVFHWFDIENWEYSWKEPLTFDGRTIEKAEFDTGGEGHGEDVYMVFKTVDVDGTEQYWRKDGYYSSYGGTDWDGDFREVRPVERTVVFYE
jgi:hypothetical protein